MSKFYTEEKIVLEENFLQNQDWDCLYMEHNKWHRNWLSVLLRSEYNSVELGCLVAHLCW